MLFQIIVEFNKDFLEISGDKITIGIKSKPERGQANLEIIKKLARHFDIPTKNIQIRSGHKSRNKIIEIL